MSTLTCYTYTLSLHDALPISRVDRRAHFGELQIVSADRDFVDGSRLFALGADDLREFGGVDLGCQCGWRRRSRRRPARALANQIERGLHLTREVCRLSVTMHMHVEHARFVKEEMIV